MACPCAHGGPLKLLLTSAGYAALFIPQRTQLSTIPLLYQDYDFSEPWDGPNNSKLANVSLQTYTCPSSSSPEGHTGYMAVIGPETAWQGSTPTLREDIADDLGGTLLLVESPTHVPWTQPTDLSSSDFVDMFTGHHEESFFPHFVDRRFSFGRACCVAFVDAHVGPLFNGQDVDTLRAMMTITGGEDVFQSDISYGLQTKWAMVLSVTMFIALSTLPIARLVAVSIRCTRFGVPSVAD